MSSRHIPTYQYGSPGAGASCVRFLEAMELKYPKLFAGPVVPMSRHKPDGYVGSTFVTEAEAARMVELRRAGQSIDAIAAALNRAKVTVLKHLTLAGLHRIVPRRKGRAPKAA